MQTLGVLSSAMSLLRCLPDGRNYDCEIIRDSTTNSPEPHITQRYHNFAQIRAIFTVHDPSTLCLPWQIDVVWALEWIKCEPQRIDICFSEHTPNSRHSLLISSPN